MIELPEATVLARQVNANLSGKTIQKVIAAYSPHKFTWYHGDPQAYPEQLTGKTITIAHGYGGWLEIRADHAAMLFSDGVNLRCFQPNEERPAKHQLLIEFTDHSALSASVQMYGGVICSLDDDYQNGYLLVAKAKPSPLTAAFTQSWFDAIASAPANANLSAKALLATEQRIPGLGNGVLQDILYYAGIHPKKKVQFLTDADKDRLYQSIKTTLAAMAAQGGRDTEKDLFGCPGGYRTRLSKNTVGLPCPACGTLIRKEAYLGGSIYYCAGCQHL